eukprot:TRINITY_DN2062_c0_g1_i1.p1 TRINITY_DN2062_c0_g1~~TRINITY_DN2062_c0_g1_i1.p1  ORF type:complete len:701 (+),score=157.98 TRINITY_DN2062_c0_g1_i1:1766-3868(+)
MQEQTIDDKKMLPTKEEGTSIIIIDLLESNQEHQAQDLHGLHHEQEGGASSVEVGDSSSMSTSSSRSSSPLVQSQPSDQALHLHQPQPYQQDQHLQQVPQLYQQKQDQHQQLQQDQVGQENHVDDHDHMLEQHQLAEQTIDAFYNSLCDSEEDNTSPIPHLLLTSPLHPPPAAHLNYIQAQSQGHDDEDGDGGEDEADDEDQESFFSSLSGLGGAAIRPLFSEDSDIFHHSVPYLHPQPHQPPQSQDQTHSHDHNQGRTENVAEDNKSPPNSDMSETDPQSQAGSGIFHPQPRLATEFPMTFLHKSCGDLYHQFNYSPHQMLSQSEWVGFEGRRKGSTSPYSQQSQGQNQNQDEQDILEQGQGQEQEQGHQTQPLAPLLEIINKLSHDVYRLTHEIDVLKSTNRTTPGIHPLHSHTYPLYTNTGYSEMNTNNLTPREKYELSLHSQYSSHTSSRIHSSSDSTSANNTSSLSSSSSSSSTSRSSSPSPPPFERIAMADTDQNSIEAKNVENEMNFDETPREKTLREREREHEEETIFMPCKRHMSEFPRQRNNYIMPVPIVARTPLSSTSSSSSTSVSPRSRTPLPPTPSLNVGLPTGPPLAPAPLPPLQFTPAIKPSSPRPPANTTSNSTNAPTSGGKTDSERPGQSQGHNHTSGVYANPLLSPTSSSRHPTHFLGSARSTPSSLPSSINPPCLPPRSLE